MEMTRYGNPCVGIIWDCTGYPLASWACPMRISPYLGMNLDRFITRQPTPKLGPKPSKSRVMRKRQVGHFHYQDCLCTEWDLQAAKVSCTQRLGNWDIILVALSCKPLHAQPDEVHLNTKWVRLHKGGGYHFGGSCLSAPLSTSWNALFRLSRLHQTTSSFQPTHYTASLLLPALAYCHQNHICGFCISHFI